MRAREAAVTSLSLVTGLGTAQSVSLSPSSLTFPTQVVGTTSGSQPVTLTNTDTTPLIISNIATTGDFAETNNCRRSLPGTGYCTIYVTFNPGDQGNQDWLPHRF